MKCLFFVCNGVLSFMATLVFFSCAVVRVLVLRASKHRSPGSSSVVRRNKLYSHSVYIHHLLEDADGAGLVGHGIVDVLGRGQGRGRRDFLLRRVDEGVRAQHGVAVQVASESKLLKPDFQTFTS